MQKVVDADRAPSEVVADIARAYPKPATMLHENRISRRSCKRTARLSPGTSESSPSSTRAGFRLRESNPVIRWRKGVIDDRVGVRFIRHQICIQEFLVTNPQFSFHIWPNNLQPLLTPVTRPPAKLEPE